MYVVNDDMSIYLTRGDILCMNVSATQDDSGEPYEFQPGDIVRFTVYGKKDADTVYLQKDFPVVAKTDSVGIMLTEADTKIGDSISKPRDYWYEIVLNPFTNPQTIVGYDEDGAKILKLFPEGKDLKDEPTQPEDIPVVDKDLDLVSSRPVENRAISRAITLLRNDLNTANERLTGDVKAINKASTDLAVRFDNLISTENKSLSQTLGYVESITEATKLKYTGRIDADGVFANVKVTLHEANLIYGGTEIDMFIIPTECRPWETGLIHTEDGLEYRIKYDGTKDHYYMSIKAQSSVTVAPSGAGTVTMSYKLSDYELKDIRVGADGVTYENAGTAVRAQVNQMRRYADSKFFETAIAVNGASKTVITSQKYAIAFKENIYLARYTPVFDAPTGKFRWAIAKCEDGFSNNCAITIGEYTEQNIGDTIELFHRFTPNEAIVILSDVAWKYCRLNDGDIYDLDTLFLQLHYNEESVMTVLTSDFKGGGTFEYVTGEEKYVTKKQIPTSAEPNYLYGKMLLTVGDSMVAGHTLGVDRSWVKKIADRNAMVDRNRGTNGAYLTNKQYGGVSNSVYHKLCDKESSMYLSDELLSDADYVLVFGGTNDSRHDITIGATDSENPAQFCGALNLVCKELQTRAPMAKVGFITPYLYKGQEATIQPYVNAIKAVCARYSIPVFDNAMNGGICWSNNSIVSALTLGDNLHLNENGLEYASYKYEAFLRSL